MDTKSDMYLASILAEIRRSWTKNPKNVKTKDFMIRYKEPKTKEQQMRDSKFFWNSFLSRAKGQTPRKKHNKKR